ncbi:Wzz/FepE/Etk N-terminal domain-containing protein [Tepidibacillus sp. HK-1]|uniref:Wzz/FepE/Etk N-terminal domain-containing protein n=1 Tax=Tepidibacillus sp. HK-1 TaxID=1883407 RepID=UPI00085332DD|nr:Wzz/FepE/Etk N-terminal domain-containing protein [Tepidibacillus sp. HK-1]GBF12580.1 chain length determinant protein [Tepidibacillus sp. HK-1]
MENVEEISLRELIEILLRGKKTIAVVTLAAMFVSAIISFFVLSPTYQITTAVVVKQIEGTESSSIISKMMNQEEVPINTLISAFDNVIAGSRMLEQVKKISPEWEGIQSGALNNLIKVDLVKDTMTVNLTVNAHSAKDAVALANIVTARFQQFIEDQNFDTLSANVKSTKRQVEMDMALLKNKLAKIKEEMAKVDKSLIYQKSIVDDPYLQELAARLGNTNVVNISKLTVQNEEPNPAYIKYLEDYAANQLALSDLESQHTELTKAEGQLKEIAKETGIKASVVRNVIEPENPVKPNKLLNVAIATVLGFMVGVFWVFLKEYWNSTSSSVDTRKAVVVDTKD